MGALLIMAMLMFLFYSSRNSELESYALTASHPGHHKRIAVTLLDAAGHDYPCDDSDGADKTVACQIRCNGNGCMEPYRLCLAHTECTAVSLNTDLSFATLKAELYPHAAASATSVTQLAEWQAYMHNASAHFTGQPRPILVSAAPLPAGRDFSCPDSQGSDGTRCMWACRSAHCTDAYGACIAHEACDALELNAPELTWATFKADAQPAAAAAAGGTRWGGVASVANESEWHVAYRAALHVANSTSSRPPQWLPTFMELRSVAATEPAPAHAAAVRPVVLSRRFAKGNDFGCAEADGVRKGTCEFACDHPDCVDAYKTCLAHVQCLGVYIDDSGPAPRATLKTYVLLQARDELHAIVLSEADWRREFLPKGRQSRHQAQPGLLPTADDRI